MGSLFSKKKKRVNQKDRAVLELKTQRDKLKQYTKKIDVSIERELQIAKELAKNGKKDRALICLKKKKLQEVLLDKANKQLLNVEEMVNQIEFLDLESKVFEGLKAGNQVLEQISKQMSVEDVEQLMDDTKDQIDNVNAISEALAGQLTDEDQEGIEDELNALEAETVDLPDVPDQPLPEKKEEEKQSEEEEEEEVQQKQKTRQAVAV